MNPLVIALLIFIAVGAVVVPTWAVILWLQHLERRQLEE